MGYTAKELWWFVYQQGKKFFSSLKCTDQLWGSPSLSFSDYQRALSVGVRQQ
jgi:hypothetical protein